MVDLGISILAGITVSLSTLYFPLLALGPSYLHRGHTTIFVITHKLSYSLFTISETSLCPIYVITLVSLMSIILALIALYYVNSFLCSGSYGSMLMNLAFNKASTGCLFTCIVNHQHIPVSRPQVSTVTYPPIRVTASLRACPISSLFIVDSRFHTNNIHGLFLSPDVLMLAFCIIFANTCFILLVGSMSLSVIIYYLYHLLWCSSTILLLPSLKPS